MGGGLINPRCVALHNRGSLHLSPVPAVGTANGVFLFRGVALGFVFRLVPSKKTKRGGCCADSLAVGMHVSALAAGPTLRG